MFGALAVLALASCRAAETAQAPDTLPPYRVAQVETLLETRLPCLGCHVIDGRGGIVGPDLSRVGERLSHAQIDSVVRAPRDRNPAALMPRLILRDDWRTLVIRYLAERGGSADPALVNGPSPLGAPPTRPEPGQGASGVGAADEAQADGAAIYAARCAVCHGATGGGDGPNAPNLPATPTVHSDPDYMVERPDDSLFDAVYAGGYIMGRSHTMPAFGATLTADETWALVRHMRELCRCQGPEWSRDGSPRGGG